MVGSSDTVDTMNGEKEVSVPVAEYYVWQPPGKPIEVHLRFDVVDRLSLEIMRGFGAVPRRGAEVGGVLLGHVRGGAVFIDGFEVVPCEYRHGPSFQLSEADLAHLSEVLERWKPETNHDLYPIGFYRSTIKDSPWLTQDDLALFNAHFPAASDLILLVKPYATRASVGGFFFREGDSIQAESSCLEFPFRRKELGGGEGVRSNRRNNRDEVSAEVPEEPVMEQEAPPEASPSAFDRRAARPEFRPAEDREREETPEPVRKAARKGNVWIPLSFIFLLLGVLLGFQAAITTRPQAAGGVSNPYSLGLRLSRNGDNVHVRWDRFAPAIRTARRGVLTITDGPIIKTVDLDAATLQNGSVIYRHLSGGLGFRLEAFPSENTSLSESIQATADRIPAEMPSRPER
jgi:hypothetical protein